MMAGSLGGSHHSEATVAALPTTGRLLKRSGSALGLQAGLAVLLVGGFRLRRRRSRTCGERFAGASETGLPDGHDPEEAPWGP